MYTNKESAEQHIMQIKREFISLSAIKVKTDKNILVPSRGEMSVDISMSRLESVQLENTFTYFTSDGYLQNSLQCPDQVIDESFPWRSQPFKVKVINNTDKDQLVLRGSVLGVLRPLASRALAQKLGDDQLSNVHVLEPITGSKDGTDPDEEVFLNAIFDDMLGTDDVNAIGDKRERDTSDENLSTDSRSPPSKQAKISQPQPTPTMDPAQVPSNSSQTHPEYIPPLPPLPFIKPNQPRGEPSRPPTVEEINQRKLPDYLREHMAFDNNDVSSQTKDVTRIVERDDEEPEIIERMVRDSRNYRLDYWQEIGKKEMLNKIKINENMPDEWKEKFLEATWNYRDTMGEDIKSISGAVTKFGIHIGTNSTPIKAAKQRNISKYSKELFNLVIKTYLDANIVKITNHSPLSHGFLVGKPKLPPGTPSMKTLADLQNPELTDKVLCSAFRLVVDQSVISRSSQDFTCPNITPKDLLSVFTKDKIFVTLDANSFFSQCTLSRASRYLTAFSIGLACISYLMNRAPQGHSAMSAAASLILKLILYGILKEGYNFTYIDNVVLSHYEWDKLFEAYVACLERARYYNLVWKISDVHLGFRGGDGPLEVLGLELFNGRVRVPRRKVENFSQPEYSKTRKFLLKVIGNANFYGHMGSGLSEAVSHLREEMDQQSEKKFVFTNRMDKLESFWK